jgi:hypothetical protein
MRLAKRHLLLLALLSCLLLIAQPVLADGAGQAAVVGRDYVLRSGQTLNHDLAVVGGKLTLQAGSQVIGSVAVTGGNVVVAGHITGDLVVIGGSLELANTAVVDGDIVTLGSINQAAGAIVRGQVLTGLGATADRRSLDRIASLGSLVQSGQWLRSIVGVFGVLFLICLVTALATMLGAIWPEKIQTVSTVMRANWLQCLGAGILTLLVVVILVPILVIICIGIPVAVVLLIVLAISGLAGWTAIGKIVGNRALQTVKFQANSLVQTLAGTLLLTLLALIPCLGTLMAAIVGSMGIGAVLLTRFGTLGYPRLTPHASSKDIPSALTDTSSSAKSVDPGDQPGPNA